MKRTGMFSICVGVLMTGAFSFGVFEPELRAQGWPETIFSVRPTGGGHALEPLETYNHVLQKVKERFYGELPADADRKLTYVGIRGMLNKLDDPYTRFLDPEEYRDLAEENEGEFEGIGAHLAPRPTKEGLIKILKPVEGGPAFRAGIKTNDLITHVDGKSVMGMTVSDAVKLIRGKANTPVRLTVTRRGEAKPLVKSITRERVEYEVVESRLVKGDVGYVYITQFNDMADRKMTAAISKMETEAAKNGGMKGLVLDLRGNPGGLLDAAIDISSRFVPKNHTVVAIEEAGGERDVRKTMGEKFLGAKWPLVVLINRTSASASEIVAGAVKDNDAGTLIGSTTFGKGLVQTVVPLEDSSACMITTAKWLRPSGKDINRTRQQRGGVEPDLPVEVTEEQWLKNQDPQLDKAVEVIRSKQKGAAVTQAR
jgi:carboxyl-terminal processing protease